MVWRGAGPPRRRSAEGDRERASRQGCRAPSEEFDPLRPITPRRRFHIDAHPDPLAKLLAIGGLAPTAIGGAIIQRQSNQPSRLVTDLEGGVADRRDRSL